MDKSKILEAIHRIAVANRGKAPGRQSFESQTGIKMSDWYPHHWLRWGDALVEAGYTPNQLQTATSDDALIQSYIALVRELQHLPVEGEIRRKASVEKSFPSHSVFGRFGGKGKLLDAILKYCQEHPGHEDVILLLKNRKPIPNDETDTGPGRESKLVTGFVYLMKSGRHYKIGHTVSFGSRERQLAVKIQYHPRQFTALKRMILLELRHTGTSVLHRNGGKVSGSIYHQTTLKRLSDGRESFNTAQQFFPANRQSLAAEKHVGKIA